MTNPDKKEKSNFSYESKIVSLSFLGDIAAVLVKPVAVVYIILVLFFIFLDQSINKTVFLIPSLIILTAAFIIILFLFMLFVWEALFSPYKIYVKDNYITCRFFYKKVFHINTDDILYVKRHKGHSKTQGTYYKDKYTLFLKNEKKFRINCFIFRNSSDINFFFTNITRLYNENYIEDIQNKKSIFCDTYHEDKYRFYVLRDGFIFLLTLCLLFLFIFLIFNRIFFPAIIVFAILAAIPAIPVKIIMNISEKTITLKSAFGIKIRKISGYDTKQIIITNNFNISVTAILDENRKKQKTFSLSLYKPKDRGKIFEILHIIFQNKVLYTLNGDEPLI